MATLVRSLSVLVALSWVAQAARRARKRRVKSEAALQSSEAVLRQKLTATLTSFEAASVNDRTSVAALAAAPSLAAEHASRDAAQQQGVPATGLGCFSEPDQTDRLGCAVREPCACHWYQRCYPKFMDDPPGEVLAATNASGSGGKVLQVNVGRCGTGLSLMIMSTILGFMGFVCVIVFFRAGTLAYEAMRLAAREEDALARVRAETAAAQKARGVEAVAKVPGAAEGVPRTQPAG